NGLKGSYFFGAFADAHGHRISHHQKQRKRNRRDDAVHKLFDSPVHRLKTGSKFAFTLRFSWSIGVDEHRINRLRDPWHVFRGVCQNAIQAGLVLGPVRYQIVQVIVMKVESLLITTGAYAANDELDAGVVDRAPQGDALAWREAIELHEFGPYDRALL